ncbi:MAG TPA: hypothetical protein DHW64_13200 [Chitinophagaceae bacterium]|nr:hypothetical protein [Chitinophagaceae bacterium]
MLIILLLLIYGSATMGATIHLHYCMNKYVGGSLWHGNDDNKCGECGMKEKKGGCCKDEHKQAKLTTDHQKTTAQFIEIPEAPAFVTSLIDMVVSIPSVSISHPTSNGPPKTLRGRLYILNCVFLI